MAQVEKLTPYSDLAMIDGIAQRYGKDPDDIFQKSFTFVMNLVVMWREQSAYSKRFQEAMKILRPVNNGTGGNDQG